MHRKKHLAYLRRIDNDRLCCAKCLPHLRLCAKKEYAILDNASPCWRAASICHVHTTHFVPCRRDTLCDNRQEPFLVRIKVGNDLLEDEQAHGRDTQTCRA